MLPFSVNQFFDVFAAYNEAVWPMQLALLAIALISILLFASTIPNKDRAVGSLLSLLWTWMAVAYHLQQFSAVNPAAYVFAAMFFVQAVLFSWSSWRKEPVRFSVRRDVHGALSALLLFYALIAYPVLGVVLGHHYPRAPTFGVPCPTTIFTLGMLTMASGARVWLLMVIPLIWVAIGGSAAFLLEVPQDIGLIAAGVLASGSLLARRVRNA